MNQKQLKQLEVNLWDSADVLRANSKLTAAEYKDPVLGLILLEYRDKHFDFDAAQKRCKQFSATAVEIWRFLKTNHG